MTDTINDGGPAFPYVDEWPGEAGPVREYGSGMSLRAYLAGQALAGLTADAALRCDASDFAAAAISLADATLAALNETDEQPCQTCQGRYTPGKGVECPDCHEGGDDA